MAGIRFHRVEAPQGGHEYVADHQSFFYSIGRDFVRSDMWRLSMRERSTGRWLDLEAMLPHGWEPKGALADCRKFAQEFAARLAGGEAPKFQKGGTRAPFPTSASAKPPKRAETAREAGVGFGDYGRVGTAAELYKRLIMEHVPVLSNDAVREEVARQLGPAAAGPRTNAAWYRNWLKRNGHRPPAGR